MGFCELLRKNGEGSWFPLDFLSRSDTLECS